jgi:hypothetical protein
MDKSKLFGKKQYGDISVVSQILTKKHGKFISAANVAQILKREKSKMHGEAIEALRQVVESRETLIAQEI